tara:strand:+ start:419 stop:1282 length:864 start_codon:yes stop_codon:yes gene_type:complete
MHTEGYALARMCRLFGWSRQGMYQGRARQQARAEQLAHLRPQVERLRRAMPRLGGRKLYYLLKADFVRAGIKLGRDGFFDYLRQQKLLVAPTKSYTKTTQSKHWMRKYPNLLPGQPITEPEQVFVSDITYVKSRKGTHYLSLVTDAYSRKIMGYHLSQDMSSEQVSKAMKMAIAGRSSTRALIHHSDRGLQYCSQVYQHLLEKHQITPSMTEGYDCYQNALAERVNGILKQEFLIHRCSDMTELSKMVSQSVKTYNTQRPHWSLNLQTPQQVHAKMAELTPSHSNYS